MSQQRVSLHLSESNTPSSLSPLHRLVSEDVYWAGCADLKLVGHHVPQALVVDNTEKDVRLKLPPVHSRVYPLVTEVIVASCKKKGGMNL